MSKSVLITGGSVSANTLAWWLTEAGFDVTVVEKSPKFREGGQSVDVRGAGRKVLERMGVLDMVDSRGTGETGWTFVNEDGKQIAAFEIADVGGDGPTAELEILRGDLAKIMFDKVLPRVNYRFGDSIADIADEGEKVRVRFKSGGKADYDLVLVAEGVGSSTRDKVFKGENHPRWMDMTLGFFTILKGETDGSDSRWYNAPGGRSVFLRPDRYGTTRAVLTLKHEAREPSKKSDAEAKAWLKETFTDAGWETPRVLEGLEKADDLYFEVLRQVKMDRWSEGRIALTGDAAWCATPVSGVGTTLAVVGAYILAGELAKTEDHAAAFAEYDRLMRPFVEQGQGAGKGPNWTHPQSRFGIMMQRTMLNVLSKPILRDAFLKLGMRDPDDIELPDYSFEVSRSARSGKV
jgi:2-polyprenyl-6-methoxyphenol hydroxylase-like FAD-dependent oxidoreductase